MGRALPIVDIAGQSYFIDLRLYEFRHVENFMNRVFIHDDLQEKGDKLYLLYDKFHQCVFRGGQAELEQRKDKEIVLVELPSLEKLDPIGFEWICNNLEEHQRSLDTLLQWAQRMMPVLEEARREKQLARTVKLQKKKLRSGKARRL